jgi:flagellar hook-associated protein 2
MSGISTGIGFFSGIDTASLIRQLLAIEARPREQAQARIAQLQLQQGAYLDLNARLAALREAAKAFRDQRTFQTRSVNSSDADILTATADTTAPNGTFQFIVDRLVTTQQVLSRGFGNAGTSALGATSFTFESAVARLDGDVALADLNGGAGVSRGRIIITDSAGASATVDLSRATTVGEVLEAINGNGSADVTATVSGGRLVVTDGAGGAGTMTIANAGGYTTAASLGIAGSAVGGVLTGSVVYALGGNTTLASLNDGRGVYIRSTVGVGAAVWNFKIAINGADVLINLGDVYENQTVNGQTTTVKVEGAVSTVQSAVERINEALADAGFSDVTASIDAGNGRLVITETSGTRTITVSENPTLNSSTAADLGILGTGVGTLSGSRILAGLNTTLARGVNGGTGIAGDGKLFLTTRDGANYTIQIDHVNGSVQDIFDQVYAETGGTVRMSLSARGTGIVVTDLTTGPGNFIITGTAGEDSAASLGISTGPTGVASNTVTNANLQRQYITRATALASLNNGRGVGTGTFQITDSTGNAANVTVGNDTTTLGQLIDLINSRGLKIIARINSQGDGVEIVEDNSQSPAGTLAIRIADSTGSVARGLNLAGTAAGTGAQNTINGSYERSVAFSAADTLNTVISKINAANVGVSAALVRDGAGATPYRLSLSSTASGVAGRFLLDTGAFDLGQTTLEAGQDARVFYGSSDAARAIAVTSSNNTVDSVLPGVRIDLHRRSDDPVTLTVARDTDAVLTGVNAFVTAFNTLVGRITEQTRYDETTRRAGPLLGDATAIELRSAVYRTVQGAGIATTGRFSTLAEVGVTVGTGGRLTLDEARFRAALDEDPASVESLFAARTLVDDTTQDVDGVPGVTVRNPNAGSTFSALGLMGQFEEMVTRYIDSASGVLTGRSRALDDQVRLQQARVTQFDARLAQRQAFLERQFQAMESAIGRLQTQQGALQSLAG